MNINEWKKTYHAEIEREARLKLLEEKIGFSKIILTFDDKLRKNKKCLTSSGIMMIMSYDDVLITAYCPNIDEVVHMYRANGKKQVTPKVYEKVLKNKARHPEVFLI